MMVFEFLIYKNEDDEVSWKEARLQLTGLETPERIGESVAHAFKSLGEEWKGNSNA